MTTGILFPARWLVGAAFVVLGLALGLVGLFAGSVRLLAAGAVLAAIGGMTAAGSRRRPSPVEGGIVGIGTGRRW